MPGSGREAFQMSGSVWEAHSDVQNWLGGLPTCPGVIRGPSRMSGSGRESLPDVREW